MSNNNSGGSRVLLGVLFAVMFAFSGLASCSGGGGSTSTNTTNSTAPTVSLTATPTSVAYNTTAVISWSSTKSTSCISSGGGGTGTTGSLTTPPLTASTTYTVTCFDAGGQQASQSVTITVLPVAITGFSASSNPPGNVTVTFANSTNFTLTSGTFITISGTTNYNETYAITNVTSTSFDIAKPFNPGEITGGFWQLAGGMIAGCSTTGNLSAINLASYTPSRFNGVAPLSVFFDAAGTTATASTRPFHDLEYRWDFDNPAGSPVSGTEWKAGSGWDTVNLVGINSRNSATGPVASHVFETPGVYTVVLSATDGTNKVSNSCAQILVQDPNTFFSGTNTICVAATSLPFEADGCPAGANKVQQPNFALAISSYAKKDKRVLFKHDDTFTGSSNANLATNGPGTIGMYGIGAKPKIHSTAANVILLGSPTIYTMQDWRIMDLEIDGQSNSSSTGIGVNGNADQITLLRLNVHDIGNGIMLNGGVLEWYIVHNSYPEHMFDQFSVVDSTFNKFIDEYGFFIFADRLAIMGTIVNDVTAGFHVVRIMHSAKGVISNNMFSNPASTFQVFTLRAPSYTNTGIGGEYFPNLLPGTAAFTSQTVVSDNHFVGGLSNQPVTVGPSDRDSWDGRFSDILFERNWYTGAGSNCCYPMLNIQAQDMTVRNELIDITGASRHRGIGILNAGTNSITSNNVKLYNNTIFSNDSVDFSAVRVDRGTTNISIVNNLAYSPNVSGSFIEGGYGTPTIGTPNTTTTNTSPLLTNTPPTTPAQFKPTCTGVTYPCAQGTLVPVWSDFFLVLQTTTRDMGAVIH